MNNEELWQSVLAQIQLNISSANFATWFKNTEIINQKEGQATVSVPNSFAKEWLEQKYNKLIFKFLHDLNEDIKEVKYIVSKSDIKTPKKPSFQAEVTEQLDFQEFGQKFAFDADLRQILFDNLWKSGKFTFEYSDKQRIVLRPEFLKE